MEDLVLNAYHPLSADQRKPCSRRCLIQRNVVRPHGARCQLQYRYTPWRSSRLDRSRSAAELALDQSREHANLVLPKDARPVRNAPHAPGERQQIFRVRIPPKTLGERERFAFVEASSVGEACSRVVRATRSFDPRRHRYRLPRVTAVSREDCIRCGVSPDLELRLFELAWHSGIVTAWVQEPIFLLRAPGALTRKWASLGR